MTVHSILQSLPRYYLKGLTLNICPLMDSSVFPPIGGAASPWAIRPIEEDVDIFDSSSDKDVAALGKSDPDASDNKACDKEIVGKFFIILNWRNCKSNSIFHPKKLKFSFSEKTTKIWKNLPLVLTLLSKNNCFVKTGGRFFQILWPSHNVWTLKTTIYLFWEIAKN